MPPEFPRPTRRTTLTQLCQELVPAWSAQMAHPALDHSPSFTVQITVDNDTQHLILHATGPRHGQGAASAPHLSISCDKEAWHTAMESLLSLAIDHLEKRRDKARAVLLVLQPQAQATLTALMQNPGTIAFTFVDDAGDPSVYTVRIGTGSGPTTQLSIDDKNLRSLVAGHAGVPQILASIDIKGDAGYLTRLVQTLIAAQ
jgi:hypothetical protein